MSRCRPLTLALRPMPRAGGGTSRYIATGGLIWARRAMSARCNHAAVCSFGRCSAGGWTAGRTTTSPSKRDPAIRRRYSTTANRSTTRRETARSLTSVLSAPSCHLPKAVQSGKVKPLTDEDRMTLVRWIDLGCPIDLTYGLEDRENRGKGWLLDDQRPTLTVTYPKAGRNEKLERILVGMHDVFSGIDNDSFIVTTDFSVNGVRPGTNLVDKFVEESNGHLGIEALQADRVAARGGN